MFMNIWTDLNKTKTIIYYGTLVHIGLNNRTGQRNNAKYVQMGYSQTRDQFALPSRLGPDLPSSGFDSN